MGFNRVVFILNDYVEDLRESPKTVLDIFRYSMSDTDTPRERCAIQKWAKENGERVPHPQALRALGLFHSSETRWYKAGGNCIEEWVVVKENKDGTVVLKRGEV